MRQQTRKAQYRQLALVCDFAGWHHQEDSFQASAENHREATFELRVRWDMEPHSSHLVDMLLFILLIVKPIPLFSWFVMIVGGSGSDSSML